MLPRFWNLFAIITGRRLGCIIFITFRFPLSWWAEYKFMHNLKWKHECNARIGYRTQNPVNCHNKKIWRLTLTQFSWTNRRAWRPLYPYELQRQRIALIQIHGYYLSRTYVNADVVRTMGSGWGNKKMCHNIQSRKHYVWGDTSGELFIVTPSWMLLNVKYKLPTLESFLTS